MIKEKSVHSSSITIVMMYIKHQLLSQNVKE